MRYRTRTPRSWTHDPTGTCTRRGSQRRPVTSGRRRRRSAVLRSRPQLTGDVPCAADTSVAPQRRPGAGVAADGNDALAGEYVGGKGHLVRGGARSRWGRFRDPGAPTLASRSRGGSSFDGAIEVLEFGVGERRGLGLPAVDVLRFRRFGSHWTTRTALVGALLDLTIERLEIVVGERHPTSLVHRARRAPCQLITAARPVAAGRGDPACWLSRRLSPPCRPLRHLPAASSSRSRRGDVARGRPAGSRSTARAVRDRRRESPRGGARVRAVRRRSR